MRRIIVSTSASGTYAGAGGFALPMDIHREPVNIGIGVFPVSGTPHITIQHTFVDPFISTTSNFWLNHTALVSASITADGNYAFPISGIRIQQVGAGDAVIYIIQAGIAP